MLTAWVIDPIKHASLTNGVLKINSTFGENDKQTRLRCCDNRLSGQTSVRSESGFDSEVISLLSRLA
jgi:hypothetical protein